MAFHLPPLPYDYDALETYISAEIMHLHHEKHHQGYTDKLNAAIAGTEWERKTIEEILSNLNALPEKIRTAVRNNGGGYLNHSIFWNNMTPEKTEAHGNVLKAINKAFGNLDTFKGLFNTASAGVFGSGWAWLVKNNDGSVEIMSTPNQDTPISVGKTPLLGLDVWEHAYYLQYQNRRPEYIDAFWHVVNWDDVEARYNR